jgi:hypothetical protein
MTRKKRVLLVALAATVLGIAAFALMAAKDRTYVPSGPIFAQRQAEPRRGGRVLLALRPL